MDDLVRDIIDADDRLVVSALRGSAGAGGVFLALAADRVWARHGILLNPHYKDMGNLYGSEYWTYLLPRRCGVEGAAKLMGARLPMGIDEAQAVGLIDDILQLGDNGLREQALCLAKDPSLDAMIAEKRARRAAEEAEKPLDEYRCEELERMRLNFYGFDPSYHVARYNFIRKVLKSRTPAHLAIHRDAGCRKEEAA
jgi:putative two-component system hydrogenase maturation factor HypX/HoxX